MKATIEGSTLDSQVDARLRRLEERLVAEQDRVLPGVVHECVERARSRFASARVRTFVPILVERVVRSQLGTVTAPTEAWAWRTAKRLLSGELPRRWAHTQGVAGRARQIAWMFGPGDRDVLVAAAWLHDIGYAETVAGTGFHQLDGARYLVAQGVSWRVCALVARHSGAAAVAELVGLSGELAVFEDECGPVRDALWYCDMTTGPDGRPVSFADRLAELRARRGPDHPAVRALATNEADRAAAVHRTEELLCAGQRRAWR
nr:HD domain-containing protein [Amycolatopsis nigrescens]